MHQLKIDTLDRPAHMPSRIASWLLQEIAEGHLKPGDKLPTEQTLATGFGVSRNVVREAIARLKADGRIQSRQGVGAFVSRAGANTTLRVDAEALRDSETFHDLFELRALLETRAAGLAAQRRTRQDLAAIQTALERMQRLDRWEEAGIDADLAFHRAIAASTGNSQITNVISFIAEQMRSSITETWFFCEERQQIWALTIAEHEKIHQAIEAEKSEAARAAMFEHICNAAGRIGCRFNSRIDY